MFGTVILDAYTKDETKELADAINDLCCPNDNYGWASAGIYCFWDYYTREVLYIGLARDLYVRFCQHNGLIPMQDSGCKYKQIQQYFNEHKKLGYTIFVQSPLSQPLVSRNKTMYEKMANEDGSSIQDYISEQGINNIKLSEGILIEAYRRAYGHFPPWNKVGGSIEGQERTMEKNINIVKSFANPQIQKVSPIVSRSTIRELYENPTYEFCENYLHAIRMLVLNFGMDYYDALEFQNKFDKYNCYKRICDLKYLDKELIV